MIYGILKSDYNKTTIESPFNLPTNIRIEIQQSQDIFNDQVSIGLSNNSIKFNCKNDYIGWEKYLKIIKRDIKKILELDIFETFNRIGLRYVSFFENVENIFEYTKLNYSFEPYMCRDTSIATIIESNDIVTILRVSSGAILNKDNREAKGSITDIDSSFEINISPNIEEIIQIIELLHEKEKKIFQDLILREKVGNYEFKYN